MFSRLDAEAPMHEDRGAWIRGRQWVPIHVLQIKFCVHRLIWLHTWT